MKVAKVAKTINQNIDFLDARISSRISSTDFRTMLKLNVVICKFVIQLKFVACLLW